MWLPTHSELGPSYLNQSSHPAGLYMTVILHPSIPLAEVPRLSLVAGAMQPGTFAKVAGEFEADESLAVASRKIAHTQGHSAKITGIGEAGKKSDVN
jgi:biotin-(acetyl-CoA carboxylase) ligase